MCHPSLKRESLLPLKAVVGIKKIRIESTLSIQGTPSTQKAFPRRLPPPHSGLPVPAVRSVRPEINERPPYSSRAPNSEKQAAGNRKRRQIQVQEGMKPTHKRATNRGGRGRGQGRSFSNSGLKKGVITQGLGPQESTSGERGFKTESRMIVKPKMEEGNGTWLNKNSFQWIF